MKKTENSRKNKKGEETKEKLFNAAVQLFNQYEFREVSVDKIVEAAGVAKGTFYIHFDSKDALIAEFISDYVHKVDTDYRAVLDSFPPDTDSSQILLGLISKIADTLTETIGYSSMRTVYQLLLVDDIDVSAVKGYGRELYQIFAQVLERGFQRGEFSSSLPLDTLIKHFVITIRGLCYEWCIRYPEFDLKAQAITHYQILLEGIKAKQ